MIISFGKIPIEKISNKTETRRQWSEKTFNMWIEAWNAGRRIHQAYNRSPRFHGKNIGYIEMTEKPYKQRLSEMTSQQLKAENVPSENVNDFIKDYFDGKDIEVVVIVFRFFIFSFPPAEEEMLYRQ